MGVVDQVGTPPVATSGASAVDVYYFDSLYGDTDDPWQMRTRWYEARKRALVDAVLPHARFGRVFEPGCGAGLLTEKLAARCDALLATDLHLRAVASARDRLSACSHVTVHMAELPRDWPEGTFDLIVLSELGYYFVPDDWRSMAERFVDSLTDRGVVVACHWRHDFDARRASTIEVHRALNQTSGLHLLCTVSEPDLLLQVWSKDASSVAQAEGLA